MLQHILYKYHEICLKHVKTYYKNIMDTYKNNIAFQKYYRILNKKSIINNQESKAKVNMALDRIFKISFSGHSVNLNNRAHININCGIYLLHCRV